MIREPQFLPGTQDLLCRRVYVIRAKPELITHLIESGAQLDADDITTLQSPTVIMTGLVPFERDLEGWRRTILNKCKEAFFRGGLEYLPLSRLDLPAELLTDMATLSAFFDRWWIAEEAESIELVDNSWKTHDCHPMSTHISTSP